MFQLIKTKEKILTTQDVINVESIGKDHIVSNPFIIGAIKCPSINTKMLSNAQANHLSKKFAQAITIIKANQIKRESEPVDLSDEIENQMELRDKEPDFIKKQLRDGYISILKENAEVITNFEKVNYLILSEQFNGEKNFEEQLDILQERLKTAVENLSYLIEGGYKVQIISGTDIVRIIEIDVNNYSAKVNRFIKESPEFIIAEKEESELDRMIEQYKKENN